MNRKNLAIGICLALGYLATKCTDFQTALFDRVVIGGPMLALLVSMILCNVLPDMDGEFKAGTTYASKKFLNAGIIITGATLSFADIIGTGIKALPLIIFNILLSFSIAIAAGRRLSVSENTSIMVGGGTAICGGTAIGTLSRILKAHEAEVAFAMAAIFLFDTLSAFSYPYLAPLLGMTANQFAFWAGTAINDTSSVAGAQTTYALINGLEDWNGALNVKLVRTTMLIFVALFWTFCLAKKESTQGGGERESLLGTFRRVFPMFILWFVVMAALNTAGVFRFNIVPAGMSEGLVKALSDFGLVKIGENGVALSKILAALGKFLFASALAGVGFKIKFREVFSKGVKPIALGGITWACVAVSSLAFVTIFAGYVG